MAALDQPGHGRGDLVMGDTPRNSTTKTAAWPHEALEPIYSWNNTINGSNVNIVSGFPMIQENRHYYNQTEKLGYTPYTYPHPLTATQPEPQPIPSATPVFQRYLNKSSKRKAKKIKKWKWSGAKENSPN
jgi:hypothetical protein